MSDFKDRMIEAVERGWTDEAHAYEYVRESYADAADMERKRRKEEAPVETFNVLVIEGGSVSDRFATTEEAREAYGTDAEIVIETPEESAEKEAFFDERVVAIREDGLARVESDEEPPDWRERIFRCSDVDESGGVR